MCVLNIVLTNKNSKRVIDVRQKEENIKITI